MPNLDSVTAKDFINAVTHLSEIDRKIQNVAHIIEYSRLDAVKLVKAASTLKNLCSERRKYKELVHLQQMLGITNKSDLTEKLEEWRSRVEERETRYQMESAVGMEEVFGSNA